MSDSNDSIADRLGRYSHLLPPVSAALLARMQGIAPDAIPATHLKDNVVDRTMPLCKFPEKAHFKGSGDPNSVANWSCPPNDKSLLVVGPNGVLAGVSATVPARVSAPAKQAAFKSGN
jgi:hypothetical protein